MSGKNVRKNAKADAAKIAEAQAIAQMADTVTAEKPTVTLHSLADLVVAKPEIVVEITSEDLEGLLPEELEITLADAELAQADRTEAFVLFDGARTLMEEYSKLEGDLQLYQADVRAAKDEYDRTHRALLKALFDAQNGKMSWAVDALESHPAHAALKKAVFAKANELIRVKFPKVVADYEAAEEIMGEIKSKMVMLKASADEAGTQARKLMTDADARLRAAGFTVKEVKSRK
jgi:hypothetical protein